MNSDLQSDSASLEAQALTLRNGHPEVREVFEKLTGSGEIHIRTNPEPETLSWDLKDKPSPNDLKWDAAVRMLMLLGLVASVTRAGPADYIVQASEAAKAVRSLYDRMPEGGDPTSADAAFTSP